MKIWKNILFFAVGGWLYVGLELLYRRRSHASMFAAGGICFLLLGKLRQLRLHPGWKPVVGAGTITAVELLTGLLANRRHTVWDYRNLRWNYRGQICPMFMLMWIPVAAAAMELHRRLEERWNLITARK